MGHLEGEVRHCGQVVDAIIRRKQSLTMQPPGHMQHEDSAWRNDTDMLVCVQGCGGFAMGSRPTPRT